MRKSIVLGMAFLLAAASAPWIDAGGDQAKKAAPDSAVAVLHPTSKGKAHGTVLFKQKDGHVHITGVVEGLTPGLHGFHVHEYGDCSADDASSAGGHFNPTGMPHGGPKDKKHHVGDLGNIQANEQGRATIDMKVNDLLLSGPHSIIGRGLIVHAKADDLKSQPSGDAGDRVACGVIGVANPKTEVPKQ